MKAYLEAINDELNKGNITVARRVKMMGKGEPVETWDTAKLKRLCQVCNIELFTPEELEQIRQKEQENMDRRGIKIQKFKMHHDDEITTIVCF